MVKHCRSQGKVKSNSLQALLPRPSSPLRSEDDEGDEDESEDHGEEEEDETSLPPPPTKVLESTVKQVGKATPLPPHTAQLRS